MLEFNSLIILVCTIIIVFGSWFVWLRRQKQKRSAILLIGLPGSGKTQLISRLVHGKAMLTVMSSKENVGTLELENKKNLKVVDIPGHERVRKQIFDSWKKSARGIVFVIDSASYQKELKDVADYLYNILIDSSIASLSPSILVFCNKVDQKAAERHQMMKDSLEKEMNILRDCRSGLQDTSGASKSVYLGKKGKDFSFSDVRPIRVVFAEGYATHKDITKCHEENTKFDIQHLKSWISEL